MDRQTVQQLRGAKELIEETLTTTTRAIADAHKTVAGWPIDALSRIGPLAASAETVGRFQLAVLDGFYGALLNLTRLVGGSADYLLDHLAGHPAPAVEGMASEDSPLAVPPSAPRRRRSAVTQGAKAPAKKPPRKAAVPKVAATKTAASKAPTSKAPTSKPATTKASTTKAAGKKPAAEAASSGTGAQRRRSPAKG